MRSPTSLSRYSLVSLLLVLILLSGCARYAMLENEASDQIQAGQSYRLTGHHRYHDVGDVLIVLAFSGGGTRASALSYGVLKALRDTPIFIDGKQSRLLDEVDRISSVSGGSFTSAYYGLYGDGIFEDFESEFLRKNVQGALTRQFFNPFDATRRFFTGESHSEIAVRYYDKHIFRGSTFANIRREGPFIFINASDMEAGEQFVFFQDSFDLLCSDLNSFKVARAVTASSAVPVVFDPVVLDNHDTCTPEKSEWLLSAEASSRNNLRLESTVSALNSYFDKENRRYIHLVDGGITDNLGVRPLYTGLSAVGDIETAARVWNIEMSPHVLFVVVDASTDHKSDIGSSRRVPGIKKTISLVTNAQLHRYNTETVELLKSSMKEWSGSTRSTDHPVNAYFVRISFEDIADPEQREFFQEIPTSFSLTDEQVDGLIDMGGQLLRENLEFRRLLEALDTTGSAD
ncbi:MAG: patatin-like phospholipase family protein [Gammaproteobacteria bacterium]|nr:patatin-like phospholipase family protein [Gammaproteobacteria bacterium]